jgi:hypothetical protein
VDVEVPVRDSGQDGEQGRPHVHRCGAQRRPVTSPRPSPGTRRPAAAAGADGCVTARRRTGRERRRRRVRTRPRRPGRAPGGRRGRPRSASVSHGSCLSRVRPRPAGRKPRSVTPRRPAFKIRTRRVIACYGL